MGYLKVCEEHQVHHVDLYIRSGMGSNESDTRDSLRKYPNMQPEDDVVIIHTGVHMVIRCACTSSVGDDLEGRKIIFK